MLDLIACAIAALAQSQACNALDKVSIAGFGVFEVSARPEREGRNPQTGKAIKIAASKNVKFKPGKGMRDAVNA